jgi:ubiquinone/menaquinone biosynthesis C-methylase UbiE
MSSRTRPIAPPRPTPDRSRDSTAAESAAFAEYRQWVQHHYDGLPGALTSLTGLLTGHELFAGRVIRPEAFDIRGCKRILDAACGDGRYSRFLLRHADPDAELTAFDLSRGMLKRASARLHTNRITQVIADITRLPYADESFDAIVCGWVLEHLPDPSPGLREVARVLRPAGKLLLLTTEDTFLGWICGRLWNCKTYNRDALRLTCLRCGLRWQRDLWFTGLHRTFHMGGIVAELRRA